MTGSPDAERAERHSRLLGIKLRALVVDHLAIELATELAPATFPNGAAMLVDDAAWILVEGSAARSLGGALAWGLRHGATSLHVIADVDTGTLARRATAFSFPISIWFPHGRTLHAAVAEPLASPVRPDPDHLAFIDVIEGAGAVANVEHGVVFGEVRGLEVCRIVDEPTVGHFAELGDVDPAAIAAARAFDELSDAHGGVMLEVGVGANDREAFRMLHGDIPTVQALAAVVESVATYRSPHAPQHPLNRLAQERALRWQLEQEPELVAMLSVVPAEPPQPRPNLKDPIPCVAAGVAADGSSHRIVCSVGVDLDLVGYVADVQLVDAMPVVVALRERDDISITRELLGLLAVPVDVCIV